MTKKYMDARGIEYSTVDITQDSEALNKLISQGFKAAPVVNANDRWWAGFQPEEIDQI
jgi:glutaredoxin-like protein NrdH